MWIQCKKNWSLSLKKTPRDASRRALNIQLQRGNGDRKGIWWKPVTELSMSKRQVIAYGTKICAWYCCYSYIVHCRGYCQSVVRSTHHMCSQPPRIFLHEICSFFSTEITDYTPTTFGALLYSVHKADWKKCIQTEETSDKKSHRKMHRFQRICKPMG